WRHNLMAQKGRNRCCTPMTPIPMKGRPCQRLPVRPARGRPGRQRGYGRGTNEAPRFVRFSPLAPEMTARHDRGGRSAARGCHRFRKGFLCAGQAYSDFDPIVRYTHGDMKNDGNHVRDAAAATARDLLTVEQAAGYLHLSTSSIRSYMRQGKLKGFRIAGRRKVLIP